MKEAVIAGLAAVVIAALVANSGRMTRAVPAPTTVAPSDLSAFAETSGFVSCPRHCAAGQGPCSDPVGQQCP